MNDNITVDQLMNLAESNSISTDNQKKIDLLLEAINDWPTSVDSLDGFLKEIRNFLKIDVLTFNTINSKIKKISPADFAWQCESLTSLMELIKENKDEIIEAALIKI
jgi:hypothetical protein